MKIYKHELKQGLKSFLIWTFSITFLLAICVFMFPEMKGEMEAVTDMFGSMGAFTDAFGMDRLNFGTLIGYYSIECGNVLGLGGSLFAALIGITIITKEEKEHTAEFLFSHPISRTRVLSEKLLAVVTQIIVMNIFIWLVAIASMAAVKEAIPWKDITLLHLAYLFMQLELGFICFGISAFIRKSGTGIGLGLAIIMYFLNIMANITEKAKFLKYISCFSYTEGADIVINGSINFVYLLFGIAYSAIAVCAAYWYYNKKDIR